MTPAAQNGGTMDDRLTTPELLPAPRRGPTCHGAGCDEKPLVQWLRRLTDEELAVEHAIIQGRRDAAWLLRDTQLPDPVFPPLPGPADFTRAVYSCGDHAIDMEDAARIHQADCAGPDSDLLPECGCEPEPLSEVQPAPGTEEQQMPAHWAAAMAGGDQQ